MRTPLQQVAKHAGEADDEGEKRTEAHQSDRKNMHETFLLSSGSAPDQARSVPAGALPAV